MTERLHTLVFAVQLLVMSDSAIPWIAACQASLSFTLSQFAQIHVYWVNEAIILCCPLLLSSVFPSIRVFSNSQLFAYSGTDQIHIYEIMEVRSLPLRKGSYKYEKGKTRMNPMVVGLQQRWQLKFMDFNVYIVKIPYLRLLRLRAETF